MKKKILKEVRLVVVGASASHLTFLKQWNKNPFLGVELIFVNPSPVVYYTGSLSSYLNGEKPKPENFAIDLFLLCQKTGVEFIDDEVLKLDAQKKQLFFSHYPPLPYDFLFLGLGRQSILPEFLREENKAIGVYPCQKVVQAWEKVKASFATGKSLKIGVYGSGMTAVELALNMNLGLQKEEQRTGTKAPAVKLLSPSPLLFPHHPARIKKGILQFLEKNRVEVVFRPFDCELSAQDLVFFADKFFTQPLDDSLAKDERGAYLVDEHCLSLSHNEIFITSTSSRNLKKPEANSGVKSVRQGKWLYFNFQRKLKLQKMQPYLPKKFPLALMQTGNSQCLLLKGPIFMHSRLAGFLKNWIDEFYLRSFFPKSKTQPMGYTSAFQDQPSQNNLVFCAGCAAKISAKDLFSALEDTNETNIPLQEDVAFFNFPQFSALESLDFIQAYLPHPYILGQVIVHHAMNDLISKNATPLGAQSLIVLPRSQWKHHASVLKQVFFGLKKALQDYHVELLGGHSAVGEELGLGLTAIAGKPEKILQKAKARAGDHIFLTKPLGAGVILHGLMEKKSSAQAYYPLQKSQLKSHFPLLKHLAAMDLKSATDISGYGFLGHLGEILNLSKLSAEIKMEKISFFPGAVDLSNQAIHSSLWQSNFDYALKNCSLFFQGQKIEKIDFHFLQKLSPKLPILFDPQTSGPLLLLVAEKQAKDLQKNLEKEGFEAQCVGKLTNHQPPNVFLSL